MSKSRNFSLYRIFSSRMVLQRGKPIVFSGRADACGELRLSFAGKVRIIQADAQGKWQGEFPAMTAGGPYELTVTGDENVPPLTLTDILIGDVWICSGQSNMEMPLCGDPLFSVSDGEQVAAQAADAQLRLFNQDPVRFASPEFPCEDVREGMTWQLCTPQTVRNFSACGYFFGRQLRRDLGVPIGLIASAWGASCIKAWTSREKWERENEHALLTELDAAIAAYQKERGIPWQVKLECWLKKFRAQAKDAHFDAYLQKDFDDSLWETEEKSDFFTISKEGSRLFRAQFELPENWANRPLRLTLGAINDMDFTYLNGELAGATGAETPGYWTHLRQYLIPAGKARPGKNVLAVLCENHLGTGSFLPAGPAKLEPVDEPGNFIPVIGWKAKTVFEADMQKLGPRPGTSDFDDVYNLPSALFNGMMNPWFKLAVKGVIWYQGCHNAGQKEYLVWHRYLIEDWRQHWRDLELPFLIVQLAGFFQHTPGTVDPPGTSPHEELRREPSFAIAREIQAEMRNVLPRVGMAAAVDIGEKYNIHPRNKETLGFRLAKEAERVAYALPVLSQGPEFEFMEKEGSRLRVHFRHTEGGLKTSDGKAPGAFILLDKAGNMAWAEAELEGDTVTVHSSEIPDPVHVRYAFAGFCLDCNLVNGAGFPALPFRSDRESGSRGPG